MLGCFPLLFEKCKLNKSHEIRASKFNRLSEAISNYHNYNLSDDEMKRKEFNIFKRTNIIGGVDPKTLNNNLEFLIRNENEENYNYIDNGDVILEREEE